MVMRSTRREVTRPITPEDLASMPTVADPRLSPDGVTVAFVVGEESREGEHEKSAIWLVDVAGDAPARRFTAGIAGDKAPRWSPDSQWLAFLSDRAEPGTPQPYLISMHGGEAERLAEIKGKVEDLAWSPDGTWLALRVTDVESEEQVRRKKERDDAIVFGQDWKYAHMWTLRLADRALTQITTDARHAISCSWSPDSSRIAVLSLESPWADASYSPALLDIYQAGGPGERVAELHGDMTDLRWSPDGTLFAMRGAEGRVSTDTAIFTLPVTGGEPRLLMPGYAGAVEWMNWAPEGTALFVAAVEDLTGTLLRVPLERPGAPEVLLQEELRGRGYLGSEVSFSADGQTVALVRTQIDQAPEVWAGPASVLRRRTAINAHTAAWAIGRVEHLRWTGANDEQIGGLLVYPAGYEPGHRYPLVLLIHGGPTSHWAEDFPAGWAQLLSSHGYAVLLPNPHGSTGRGAAFADAEVDDIGGKELEDDLRGVDAVVAMGLADPERLGVGGWSHGGYMTAWTVTQTTRFKAAVMGAGLCNLLSDQGQNDFPRFNDDYYDARTYDDPDAYMRRSPITFVRRVTTPTLIVHGAADERVHPAQGREFFIALRLLSVPTEFVLYPREEHSFKERKHKIDLYRRVLEWYDRYLR